MPHSIFTPSNLNNSFVFPLPFLPFFSLPTPFTISMCWSKHKSFSFFSFQACSPVSPSPYAPDDIRFARPSQILFIFAFFCFDHYYCHTQTTPLDTTANTINLFASFQPQKAADSTIYVYKWFANGVIEK